MEVLLSLPDDFVNLIKHNNISKEKYDFSIQIGGRNLSRLLSILCNQNPIEDNFGNEIMYTNFSYNYETCMFNELYSIPEERFNTSTLGINTHDSCIILSIYDVRELIRKNIKNKYIFVPLIVNNSTKFNYNDKEELHATMLIIDLVNTKVYYMDPNGFGDVLLNSEELKGNKGSYSRFTLDELFLNYTMEILPEYEYVPMNEWLMSISGHSLQNSNEIRVEYDRGNCLTITVLFAQCLYCSNFDLLTLYQFYDTLDPAIRANLIYSYTCGIYKLLK